MNFTIKHVCSGRIRVRMAQKSMTPAQADLLEAWLQSAEPVQRAAVHERTCCAIIEYRGSRMEIFRLLHDFSYDTIDSSAPEHYHSSRELNRTYGEKLVCMAASKV